MPILHFRLTKAHDSVLLLRTIHSQNSTLRRCIVTKNRSVATNAPTVVTGATDNFIPDYTTDYKGGIILDCAFLSGGEIISNFNSNDILIPFSNAESNIDNRFIQNFASEDVSTSFSVKSFDFEKQDTIKFMSDSGNTSTTDGAVKYIDVFFEFDEVMDYNTY